MAKVEKKKVQEAVEQMEQTGEKGVIMGAGSQPEREELVSTIQKMQEVTGIKPELSTEGNDETLIETIKAVYTKAIMPHDKDAFDETYIGVFQMLGLPWPPPSKKKASAQKKAAKTGAQASTAPKRERGEVTDWGVGTNTQAARIDDAIRSGGLRRAKDIVERTGAKMGSVTSRIQTLKTKGFIDKQCNPITHKG